MKNKYLHKLWETLFPIIWSTLQWNMRITALDIYTPVGKNYLWTLHIMEDTAPDNGFRIEI